jgi:hypothetical protein
MTEEQVAARAVYIAKRNEMKEECKASAIGGGDRYLHVLYSMFRGRTYPQIEQKVREHNELDKYYFEKAMKRFNVTEADIQWETLKWK